MDDDTESFHLNSSSSSDGACVQSYEPPSRPSRPSRIELELEPDPEPNPPEIPLYLTIIHLFQFGQKEGQPCRNACRTCINIISVLVGAVLAIFLALGIAIILFTIWFPKHIHLLPKFPRKPDPTGMPGYLTAWGIPPDQPCGPIRLVLKRSDCDSTKEECLEGRRQYEEEGIGEKNDDLFWNVTRTCFRAAECLDFLACREADEDLDEFRRVPHEFFMTHREFPKCMLDFYRSLKNETSDNCTMDYDYLSKSYKIKNRAYIDGKECFMSFVWENCDGSVFDYLVMNYNAFLNLVTVPSDNCGAFQKIESLECRESAEKFKESVHNVTLAQSSREDFLRVAVECDEMQHCFSQLYDNCVAKKRFLMQTKEYCNKMHFLASPLIQCLQKLKSDNYHPNLRKYPCFIGHDFNDDATACIRFRDSTNCVKRIMSDYCGREVLDGFDDTNSYLLEMWDC